ncbi:MAG: hypothetical protein ACRDGA_04405, partial [Bacteroidota bacterium]
MPALKTNCLPSLAEHRFATNNGRDLLPRRSPGRGSTAVFDQPVPGPVNTVIHFSGRSPRRATAPFPLHT